MYEKKCQVEIGLRLVITVNVSGRAGLGQNVPGLESSQA